MANAHLTKAKAAKNDEFYTLHADIESEVNAYVDYDADIFRDKVVLLPCDDPDWSMFTRFFAQKFEKYGIKKLISTSYAPKKKVGVQEHFASDLEKFSDKYDAQRSVANGKLFVLERDTNKDGVINIDDLEWSYLDGDGDFRSQEVTKLRDEADIIITNPPFSLFREYMAWVTEAGKQFAVIANKNCITYKEIFPLIRDNHMWVGSTSFNKDLLFSAPGKIDPDNYPASATKVVNGKVYLRSPSVWFSSIEHGRRHEPLQLMTMADNLRFHKKMKDLGSYAKYDNYDAIDVPFTNAIPSDYTGEMGVPISFLDKYCPEQFEIVRFRKGDDEKDLSINGKCPYFRIIIRKKQ